MEWELQKKRAVRVSQEERMFSRGHEVRRLRTRKQNKVAILSGGNRGKKSVKKH